VVIGSRIIQEIENAPKDGAAAAVQAFVAGIRSALDA
jgi:tryptophan synthase alpha chain